MVCHEHEDQDTTCPHQYALASALAAVIEAGFLCIHAPNGLEPKRLAFDGDEDISIEVTLNGPSIQITITQDRS